MADEKKAPDQSADVQQGTTFPKTVGREADDKLYGRDQDTEPAKDADQSKDADLAPGRSKDEDDDEDDDD